MAEHMVILEHEAQISPGALAARAETDIQGIGATTSILNRSYLCKKMEIEFTLAPPFATDDAASTGMFVGSLIIQNQSQGTDADTVAESFDAALENQVIHSTVIWSRNFIWQSPLVDDTDNVAHLGLPVVFKTSKSFSKGMPFDKDSIYQWKLFNPSSSLAWLTGSSAFLRVRYFGVWL